MVWWGGEHKFWNIRYKRKYNVQMFLTKNRMNVKQSRTNVSDSQMNAQFSPLGSETWNKE